MTFLKLLAFCALLFISTPMTAHNHNIPYFNGLSIMHGFSIIPDSIMVFDKPEGQIVEISMVCDVNCPKNNDISTFYYNSLMNLGWLPRKSDVFYKNNEELSINIQNEDQSVIITLVKR